VRRAVGWVYFYARRFDQARDHLSRAIEMNPMAVESYRMLGSTVALQGETPEAERVLREALTLPGAGAYSRATLGWALARAGRPDEATRSLEELRVEARSSYVSPVAFAILHIGMGNLEAALDWCDRAFDARRGWLAYLKVNPIFDPLKDEARFKALVEKMRL
jgi:tetratricopeptide (TPR) repeat protein